VLRASGGPRIPAVHHPSRTRRRARDPE
jgi:hypothetical protein